MTAPRDFVKSGSIVRMADNDMYLVLDIHGTLFLIDNYRDSYKLSGYDEKLHRSGHDAKVYDITAVYRYTGHIDDLLSDWRDHDNCAVVWERKETMEMTVEEISKALGYEVKVVR